MAHNHFSLNVHTLTEREKSVAKLLITAFAVEASGCEDEQKCDIPYPLTTQKESMFPLLISRMKLGLWLRWWWWLSLDIVHFLYGYNQMCLLGILSRWYPVVLWFAFTAYWVFACHHIDLVKGIRLGSWFAQNDWVAVTRMARDSLSGGSESSIKSQENISHNYLTN